MSSSCLARPSAVGKTILSVCIATVLGLPTPAAISAAATELEAPGPLPARINVVATGRPSPRNLRLAANTLPATSAIDFSQLASSTVSLSGSGAHTGKLATPASITTATCTNNTCIVSNCTDGLNAALTYGTLRYWATNAPSGDTISLTGCGAIFRNFSNLEITLAQSNITIVGNGSTVIDGRQNYGCSGYNGIYCPPLHRIFNHTGTGTLTLKNLTVRYGLYTGQYVFNTSLTATRGGCVFSNGDLHLDHVSVNHCTLSNAGSTVVRGGGVYARGGMEIFYSTISGGSLTAGSGATALGGGASASNEFNVRYSTVSNNTIVAPTTALGAGGGLGCIPCTLTLVASTVARNTAPEAGGIFIQASASGSVIVANSTISNNASTQFAPGGLEVRKSPSLNISNSTIASNTANSTFGPAGLYIWAYSGNSISLQSSIVSQNMRGSSEVDVGAISSATYNVSGSNNLVRVIGSHLAFSTTPSTACPLLGPLRNNGGLTQTRALLSGSPAIDAGSYIADNPSPGNGNTFQFDQRGSPYNRVNTTVDIGAYEVQPGVVFNAGFDGCAD